MEGQSIPKKAPEQILYVGKEKWKIIVYENSPRMGTEADNLADIKNRVTVAINANNDAPLLTSETPRRFPLFDSNIDATEVNVIALGLKLL